jgi:uncharacterized protein with PQ loop repeat
MTAAAALGWLAVVISTTMGLPQLIRLAKTRNVQGVSLTAWQFILAMNLAWTAHGIRISQAPLVVTNALGPLTTVPILYFLARASHRKMLPTLLPSVLFAAAAVGVDLAFGSAPFGVAAVGLAVVANVGQSLELIRAPHVRGVATLFMVLAVVNQVVWLGWSLLIADPGSTISAVSMSSMAAFNLVWYVLRRLGLRPFFPTGILQPEVAAGS